MKISKAHQEFANALNYWYETSKQDALNYPGDYLGLNWEEVINFWLYLDTLTEEQFKVVEQRYFALSSEERHKACCKAWDAAKDATDYADVTGINAAYNAEQEATYELIGLDKLLERGHQPVFFPMFLNL
jgi:hypothetical protein